MLSWWRLTSLICLSRTGQYDHTMSIVCLSVCVCVCVTMVASLCLCVSLHLSLYLFQQSSNQRGTAWGENPRQTNNLLGANLTPADRHGGSVQVRITVYCSILPVSLLHSLNFLLIIGGQIPLYSVFLFWRSMRHGHWMVAGSWSPATHVKPAVWLVGISEGARTHIVK